MQIDEFKALCTELFKKRAELETLQEQEKALSKDVEGLKHRIISVMDAMELENFHVPGLGKVYTQDRFNVSMPKDPEARQRLFAYLKDKKILSKMVTINHQTLNAWYKEEMQAAVDGGQLDFKVPGIEESSHVRILSLRKE